MLRLRLPESVEGRTGWRQPCLAWCVSSKKQATVLTRYTYMYTETHEQNRDPARFGSGVPAGALESSTTVSTLANKLPSALGDTD